MQNESVPLYKLVSYTVVSYTKLNITSLWLELIFSEFFDNYSLVALMPYTFVNFMYACKLAGTKITAIIHQRHLVPEMDSFQFDKWLMEIYTL